MKLALVHRARTRNSEFDLRKRPFSAALLELELIWKIVSSTPDAVEDNELLVTIALREIYHL
jgi:hypothetical protein